MDRWTVVVNNLVTVTIGEYENGKTVLLTKDQILELSLITNPSTGYTWQYLQYPSPKILTEIKHYLVPQGRNPGSPSMEYWLYNPVNLGVTVISLQYSRSWSNVPPLKIYQINIMVN
jgi:inhibitor of cysteine peptidase